MPSTVLGPDQTQSQPQELFSFDAYKGNYYSIQDSFVPASVSCQGTSCGWARSGSRPTSSGTCPQTTAPPSTATDTTPRTVNEISRKLSQLALSARRKLQMKSYPMYYCDFFLRNIDTSTRTPSSGTSLTMWMTMTARWETSSPTLTSPSPRWGGGCWTSGTRGRGRMSSPENFSKTKKETDKSFLVNVYKI